MDFRLSQSRLKVFSLVIKVLSLCVITSVTLNIVMSVFLMRCSSQQSIVLVPNTLKEESKIDNRSVSSAYLEAVATMILEERLNVTPDSVSGSNENLLRYVSPHYYASFKEQLKKDEMTIKRKKISSAFYPSEMIVDTNKLQVLVKGSLKRWVGLRSIGSENRMYKMTFVKNGYLVLLQSFKAMEDGNVRK